MPNVSSYLLEAASLVGQGVKVVLSVALAFLAIRWAFRGTRGALAEGGGAKDGTPGAKRAGSAGADSSEGRDGAAVEVEEGEGVRIEHYRVWKLSEGAAENSDQWEYDAGRDLYVHVDGGEWIPEEGYTVWAVEYRSEVATLHVRYEDGSEDEVDAPLDETLAGVE